jgi:hypothetical protein
MPIIPPSPGLPQSSTPPPTQETQQREPPPPPATAAPPPPQQAVTTCKTILASTLSKPLLAELQTSLSHLKSQHKSQHPEDNAAAKNATDDANDRDNHDDAFKPPHLLGILANTDPAAKVYAEWTGKTCEEKYVRFQVSFLQYQVDIILRVVFASLKFSNPPFLFSRKVMVMEIYRVFLKTNKFCGFRGNGGCELLFL